MAHRYCSTYFIAGAILSNFAFIIQLAAGVDYSGYKIYEAVPSNHIQYTTLESVQKLGVEHLQHSRNNSAKFLISPDHENGFKEIMEDAGIFTRVLLEDVGRVIEKQRVEAVSGRRFTESGSRKFNFDRFPGYEEMVQFLYDLANESNYAKVITVGESSEGRPILALRLQTSKENPLIFVDAGMHAREWAAPVTALYIMRKIVENEEALAKKMSIYVIPLVNPDGYEYTRTEDRFWRKSKSRSKNTTCIGVDLNRNFDSFWGVYGTEKDPCSQLFPGYAPFTEPEAVAVKDALLKLRPDMYLTLHSYGPLLLYPWGFTHSLPSNWKELDKLAHEATDALKKVNGQNYRVGSSANVLYFASGGSDDWAMQKVHVPLVYTMELPDYGSTFIVPIEKIKPMVEETYVAFEVFMKHVCSKHHTSCE